MKKLSIFLCSCLLCAAATSTFAETTVDVDDLATLQSAISSYESATDDMVITVTADLRITKPLIIPANESDKTLTLTGNSADRTITRVMTSGYLFTVSTNATLVLENIIICGEAGSFALNSLINVGGTLVMNSGEISGNSIQNSSRGDGAGVSVYGIFTMNGGKISGNSVNRSNGGGVNVDGGTFIMNEGEISENTVYSTSPCYGGSVIVLNKGIFTMNGGTISNSSVSGGTSSSSNYGGGVYVNNSTFTMNAGTISGNRVTDGDSRGGGVYIDNKSTFVMNSGTINNNTGTGGGIYVTNSSTFTMNDGMIDSNIGSGVYVNNGTFIMTNGMISNNTTIYSGGGVYVYNVFTMTGGTITNNSARSGGGGVYKSVGTLTFGGTAVVSGNTLDNGTTDNVHLSLNEYITIGTGTNEPKAEMNIGITIRRTTNDNVFAKSGATAAMVAYFFSDNENLSVVHDNGQLRLVQGSSDLKTIHVAPLQVYPNPTISQLQVASCELQVENAAYSIFNAMGQLILQGKLQDVINVETLASGVYYLQIGGQTLKFVKE